VTLLAHGVGGSTDLPIPYTYALIGAAWALTLTFAVVALAWRTPRFDPAAPGHRLPRWVARLVDSSAVRLALGLLTLAFALWVVLAAVFGPQDARNALPGAFYVLLWVGLVAVSVLVGPVWRAFSPPRTLWRLVRGDRTTGLRAYPAGWGYRPAALGLFAFVWLELASPNPGALSAIKTWLLCYVVLAFAGAALFGTRWFARADPFEVYSMVASRVSPFRRNPAGNLVVGNPFDHLPSLPVRSGTVAVLAVLLGSTAFDSFSAMPQWRGFVERLADGGWAATAVNTAGLIGFIGAVATTFWFAARATGGVDRAQRRALPGLLAHSLVPIVLGYVFAHYLSYLIERGQQTLIALADPLDRGWNLLGLGNAEVSYLLSMHPTVLATLKVAGVVVGHMAGVIAAHDAALRLLPKRHQLTGQLAMMVVMVAYTFTGLYLLFGG
jgi:hypothetical protein